MISKVALNGKLWYSDRKHAHNVKYKQKKPNSVTLDPVVTVCFNSINMGLILAHSVLRVKMVRIQAMVLYNL